METKSPAQNSETARSTFHAALVAAYSDLFANDEAYAYSASKTTPAQMADRMLSAAISGSINHEGEGVKRACKACGIKHTLKAVLEFVGHAPAVKAAATPARARKVQVIGLSNIHSMMSGVARISRAHDLVTLEYTDGTREAGKVTDAQWAEGIENPFHLVSLVQSQRVNA